MHKPQRRVQQILHGRIETSQSHAFSNGLGFQSHIRITEPYNHIFLAPNFYPR
jgi:hypothetical protein